MPTKSLKQNKEGHNHFRAIILAKSCLRSTNPVHDIADMMYQQIEMHLVMRS